MALINEHYLKLTKNYLFADIAKKVNAFKATHPKADVISLGIGDVTQPLCPAVIEAMHKAVDEMAAKGTFHGYGPEQGYMFLREAIVKNDFLPRGVHIDPSEVFINDGAKSDTGSIGELLRWDNNFGVTDPIYPVYIDSNVMCGRAGTLKDGRWSNVTYLPCNIQDPDIPHSIYEIKGAKKVAVEFHSYSKTAGFTGVRCGYTVVPKELTAASMDGSERYNLNEMWLRRQSTKFNGTSYISQRAAEAIYTPEGKAQVKAVIGYYMENARLMREALKDMGLAVYGGENAPYLWVKTPGGEGSWRFFEQMLYGAQVVCTPGVGFGPSGEGFVRLTAFGDREQCIEALKRMREWMKR